jgi:hypothetical protein
VICNVLADFGVSRPQRKVEVFFKSGRLEAAFILDHGQAGTLAFSGGSERWFPAGSTPRGMGARSLIQDVR